MVDYDSSTGTVHQLDVVLVSRAGRISSPISRGSAASRKECTRSAPTRCRVGSEQCRPGLAGDVVRAMPTARSAQRPGSTSTIPARTPDSQITSSDSVYGNQVVGIVIGAVGTSPTRQPSTIGFQFSNVISGNGGNGIELNGGQQQPDRHELHRHRRHRHAAISATAQNGILITGGSASNMIGGAGDRRQRSDERRLCPAAARQPDLRQRRRRRARSPARPRANQLSGNFIGTTAAGSAAAGQHAGWRGDRQRQQQFADRLHVPAEIRSCSTT